MAYRHRSRSPRRATPASLLRPRRAARGTSSSTSEQAAEAAAQLEAPSDSKTADSFNGEEEEPSPEEGAQERHPAARALEQAFESAGADAPEHARPAGRLRRKLFLALKQDVINATHVPLTHAELCTASISSPGIWPTCMEAISRSVAAYHKAASATEHDACVSIAANIGGYAHTLSQMVHRPDGTLEDFLMLLHKWIENRSVNMALKTPSSRHEFLATDTSSPVLKPPGPASS